MGEKPNEPDKIWKEITDLKEKTEYLEDRYKESGGLKCLRDRGLIREVLRDSFQAIINAINKNTGIGLLASELEDILKKLDSDPVQKRIDALDEGGKILKKHEEALNSKASGGEKDSDSLKIGLQNVGKHSIDKTEDGGSNPPHDSKLPEVKYIACRFCKSSNIEHQGWGNEHCYFCNDCKKTCKSPLEITRKELNEPEKDDEIVMIPMTKIALETFAKEIEKKLIEEFIRIVADLYYRDNNLAFMEAKQELEGRLNK